MCVCVFVCVCVRVCACVPINLVIVSIFMKCFISKLACFESFRLVTATRRGTKEIRQYITINSKHDRQRTYNVILGRVRVTIVVVEKH